MVRNFMKLLKAKWDERRFVCVGLDSDAGKLPILHLGFGYSDEEMLDAQETFRYLGERDKGGELIELTRRQREILSFAQAAFNRQIVESTHDLVCAYKPNSAFYEPLGDQGMWALGQTFYELNTRTPDIPGILDYKRGDIGNTNLGYVLAAARADAVTVHPYLGREAMTPFLDQTDKGVIVLVRTSNPGAGEFQDLEVHQGVYYDDTGEAVYGPLYQRVARHIAGNWNYNGNCAVVAGATYPSELAEIRKIVGDMPILIPGIGKQGGDLEATVKAGANSKGQGMIINNSRSIIFASDGPDFAMAARAAALKMHEDINIVLAAA
jgi:orotidine-5'-phosphate decarboxylase